MFKNVQNFFGIREMSDGSVEAYETIFHPTGTPDCYATQPIGGFIAIVEKQITTDETNGDRRFVLSWVSQVVKKEGDNIVVHSQKADGLFPAIYLAYWLLERETGEPDMRILGGVNVAYGDNVIEFESKPNGLYLLAIESENALPDNTVHKIILEHGGILDPFWSKTYPPDARNSNFLHQYGFRLN